MKIFTSYFISPAYYYSFIQILINFLIIGLQISGYFANISYNQIFKKKQINSLNEIITVNHLLSGASRLWTGRSRTLSPIRGALPRIGLHDVLQLPVVDLRRAA